MQFKPGTRAYSYVRFSSAKQELGASLKRQTELAQAFAASHRLVLDDRSFQDLGVSAWKGKNATEGELGTFIAAIDAGQIRPGSVLLVEDFDRLSRAPVMTALHLMQTIMSKGISIVTLNDSRLYNTQTLDADWTILIIALSKMAGANGPNDLKAGRVADAWRRKREAAVMGKRLTRMCPVWLKPTDDGWEVVNDKAEIVRKIFQLAQDGMGSPTIAERLNKEGIPIFDADAATRRLTGWTHNTVAYVLKNPAVMGRLQPRKIGAAPIDDYYPQIVSPTVFYAVQQAIVARRGTGKRGEEVANLFSGRCYCAICGGKVQSAGANNGHRYLKCENAKAGLGCDSPRYPYKAVEQAILHRLINVQARNLLADDESEERDPTFAMESEIADKLKRIERLLTSVEDGAAPAGLVTRVRQLEGEIEALREKLRTYTRPVPLGDAMFAAIDARHELEAAEHADSETRTRLRMRLQGALRQVISRVDFREDAKHVQVTFISRKDKSPVVRDLLYTQFKLKKGFQPGNKKGVRTK